MEMESVLALWPSCRRIAASRGKWVSRTSVSGSLSTRYVLTSTYHSTLSHSASFYFTLSHFTFSHSRLSCSMFVSPILSFYILYIWNSLIIFYILIPPHLHFSFQIILLSIPHSPVPHSPIPHFPFHTLPFHTLLFHTLPFHILPFHTSTLFSSMLSHSTFSHSTFSRSTFSHSPCPGPRRWQ